MNSRGGLTVASSNPTPMQTVGRVMALTAIVAILAGIFGLYFGAFVAALCLFIAGGVSGLWAVVVLAVAP